MSLKKLNACWPSRLFPPDDKVEWDKGHHRLDRRRLARVAVTPEEIGLCGCWQVIAVRRERVELGSKAGPPTDEIGYYATSIAHKELTDNQLLEAIIGHWDAIENGSHYRRDVSLGEDASRVAKRGAAQVMATLRNLVIGIYELEEHQGRSTPEGLKSWCRKETFSAAFKLLQ